MDKIKDELNKNLGKKSVPWEGKITNIQANMLEALAKYKFMTIPHMLMANVGTSDYVYAWRQISSLRDRRKPLVYCTNYDVPEPRKGRVFSMYNLTKEGKKALINELEYPEQDIRMPALGKSTSYRLYPHRVGQINFQIQLDNWTDRNELEVTFFDRDFDFKGNNRVNKNLNAQTRIELGNKNFFIPDGAFNIRNKYSKDKFYLLEYERGDKTAKALKKIHQHAEAMTFRCTHTRYNLDHNKSYIVAFMFETESLKNLVIERAKQDEALSLVKKYFICKSIETIDNDNFFDSWQSLSGIKVNFY